MIKKKKIILVSVLGVITSILVLGNLVSNKLLKEERTLYTFKRNQTLAVYIQDENRETGYSKSNSTKFPTDGYILNLEKSSCTNGGTLSQDSYTKKVSISVDYQNNCLLYFDKLQTNVTTTLEKLNKVVKSGNPNFALASTTDETADGLYAMEDDYGTSYYYRGAVEDNYVKFAGFYWRIIRVNGDGSLRIIYDGTEAHTNGENNIDRIAIQKQKFNLNDGDAQYIGYMYGGSGTSVSKEQAQTNELSSNIKIVLENWYKTNIANNGYDSYVSDNIFCNDREIATKSETTNWNGNTGLGYGTYSTAFQPYKRFLTNLQSSVPQLSCKSKNNAFTKNDTEFGNGKLQEKIGLITTDEAVLAGSGKNGIASSSYYLYKGSLYWTLSPYVFDSGASMFSIVSNGDISYNNVSSSGGIAPVINLSSDYVYMMRGSGTIEDPFEVK